MIELRLLGNPELGPPRRRATPSPLSQPKRIALLAYLALARPRGFHRRDKLLGLFWPEADTNHARSALRSAVYFLRRNLGDDVLISRGDTEIGIDPTQLWCDAAAFEDAVMAGRTEEALALYRGPLLDGFFLDDAAPEFDRWLEEERTRLHALAAEAAWQLAGKHESLGDATSALKWARRASEFSPGDETVMRRLISLMDRHGDRAAALRTYDAFVAQLKSEYDLDPSAETRDLIESIRSRPDVVGTVGRGPAIASEEEPSNESSSPPGKAFWHSRQIVQGTLATILLAVIVLLIAVRLPIAGRRVTEERTLIVLPFRTAGPGVEAWREGMVDALATDLDGVGGLRVIDPRTALSGWTGDSGGSAASLEQVFDFALNKGARYVLTGSLLHSGNRVRVVVELHDAAQHKRLNTESLEGAADSVLVLADRISINLLRRSVLGAAELRLVNANRTQTSSPAAIKALLEGEYHWRRSQFGEASAAYARAVQADSAFAFAWLRLFESCGWTGVVCSDSQTVFYRERAFRYADRLPNRDREFLRAALLLDTDLHAAIDSLKRFTARYPDDVEGWYLLGDQAYHAVLKPGRARPAEGLTAFRRVIELDPSFGPAYEHLIPDAFARSDTTDARRLIEQLRSIDAANDRVIGLSLALGLAFGTPSQHAAARAALDTASIAVLESAQFNGFVNCCASSPALWQLEMLVSRARSAARHKDSDRNVARIIMTRTLLSRGRFKEADSIFRTIPLRMLTAEDAVTLLDGRVGVAADTRVIRRAAAVAAQMGMRPVHYLYANATRAVMDGPAQEAGPYILALENSGSPAATELARGLRALAAGRKRQAALALEDALHSAPGSLPYQLRYDLGRLWLEVGDLRRAQDYFTSLEMIAQTLNAPIEFYLGKVNERLGNIEQARLHYARFIEWWQDCDTEVRPLLDEGRRGLARVQSQR